MIRYTTTAILKKVLMGFTHHSNGTEGLRREAPKKRKKKKRKVTSTVAPLPGGKEDPIFRPDKELKKKF